MLTEADQFVIQVALDNQLIDEETARLLRTTCLNEASVRALDLIKVNGLIPPDAFEQLHAAVAERFGKSEARPAAVAPATPTARAATDSVPQGNIRFRHIRQLLDAARHLRASDLHVSPGIPPIVRIHGQLVRFKTPPLSADDVVEIISTVVTDEQRHQIEENWQADFAYQDERGDRYRCSVVKQRLGFEMVMRLILHTVPPFDSLGLPPDLKRLVEYTQGLVLVTGPVGSGKSTTLAALIEEINRSRHEHIVTLEDPIEFVFQSKNCQITQREIPTHSRSFSVALRAALREDPDVIMVGEMRDLETLSLAITASETGHLVLGTLHTNNAARTIDRLLDVFPPDQQAQIRTSVAESLKGIISQQLVPTLDGTSRVVALEVLVNTPAIAACIREAKTFLIPGIIQTGRKIGMRLMDDSLMELLQQGKISGREAYERAEIKGPFAQFVDW
jgi:twitching motility protein PilT